MTETPWRVLVDREACIGSAVCAGTSPARFRMADNTAVPVASEIEPDEDVLAAADSCPMEAIRVVDTRTGEVLAPPGWQ